MASQTMNKNIFSAFCVEKGDNSSTQVDKSQKCAIQTTGSDNGFQIVNHKDSKKDTNFSNKNAGTRVPSREVVRQKPVHAPMSLDNFPALGTTLNKAQEKELALKKSIDAKKVYEKVNNKPSELANYTRSRSFANMADKENVAKSLTCTKACRMVTQPYIAHVNHNQDLTNEGKESECKDPVYGVCYRETCTFAHGMDQFKPPLCGFDGNCRFTNGKYDHKNKKKIPNSKCRFRHSFETVDEWVVRSNASIPTLPETSENTRKPVYRSLAANTSAKVGVAIPPPAEKSVETNRLLRKKPSRFDEKPAKAVETKFVIDVESDSSESGSSESGSSESSDSADDLGCKGSWSSKHPVKRSPEKDPVGPYIEVPTEELKKIILKDFLERGVFNATVKVVC
jgi:hypothetical protein